MKKLLALLTIVFSLLGSAKVNAKDEACTYGTNCLCDNYKNDASILFCEDGEDPLLANTSTRGHWADKYGPGDDNCLVDKDSVALWRQGFYPEATAVSTGRACVAQPQETSCEVAGQTDCVFQGKYSIGHRQQPGKTQGILGTAQFKRTSRRFGSTMAIKWSRNYLVPGGNNGPAHKMNEWGRSWSPLMGFTGWSDPNVTTNHPFVGGFIGTGLNPVASIGTVAALQFGTYFSPDKTKYLWGTTNNLDQWGCFQMHWDGVGTTNTNYRYWFNGVPIMAGTMNTTGGSDSGGIGSFVWNNYYNGPGTGTGYPGSTVAYRYEDNVIVTDAAEPISCASVGFGSVTPPPTQVCGNNIREGTEVCDGASSCTGTCNATCTICTLPPQPPVPANNSYTEPTRDANGLLFNQTSTVLQSCSLKLYTGELDSLIEIGNTTYPATSPLGGGTVTTGDPFANVNATAMCGKTVNASVSCTTNGGAGAGVSAGNKTYPPCTENCSINTDADGDGLIGCADPDCAQVVRCRRFPPSAPIWNP